MKSSKQQAIELAYGKAWEKLDSHVQKNILENEGGWTYEVTESWLLNTIGIPLEYKGKYCRPLSLKGIETNNNWISILSKKDLPSEQVLCVLGLKTETDFIYGYEDTKTPEQILMLWKQKQITHYQIVEKRQPPIH